MVFASAMGAKIQPGGVIIVLYRSGIPTGKASRASNVKAGGSRRKFILITRTELRGEQQCHTAWHIAPIDYFRFNRT
jgi:hypothetical protein